MLKPIFLTQQFYDAYRYCPEIETKGTRPYIRVGVRLHGVLWAVPLRSHITHEYAIWTDKKNLCGLDFTKAVVVEKPSVYISSVKPFIRPAEFSVLKDISDYEVDQKLRTYISAYKKAKQHMSNERNKRLVQFSTLQYFERYI